MPSSKTRSSQAGISKNKVTASRASELVPRPHRVLPIGVENVFTVDVDHLPHRAVQSKGWEVHGVLTVPTPQLGFL